MKIIFMIILILGLMYMYPHIVMYLAMLLAYCIVMLGANIIG